MASSVERDSSVRERYTSLWPDILCAFLSEDLFEKNSLRFCLTLFYDDSFVFKSFFFFQRLR